MNVFELSPDDIKYVTDLIKGGTEFKQAFAQLDVMKTQYEFKQNVLDTLSEPEVIEKIVKLVVANPKEFYD